MLASNVHFWRGFSDADGSIYWRKDRPIVSHGPDSIYRKEAQTSFNRPLTTLNALLG